MRKKGNIILIFIMIVFLSAIVLSFLFIVSSATRTMTGSLNSSKALYVAEAGINKALWYLSAPAAEGGLGPTWRPIDFSESYGDGTYTLSIINNVIEDNVSLISTGRVGWSERTVRISLERSGLPAAFDYALFNHDGLALLGNTNVWGDVHVADGNLYVGSPADIEDGYATVMPGYSISGGGSYEEGSTPDPAPQMPDFDYSYYDNQINNVYSGDPSVLIGDQYINDYALDGQTIYISGEAELSGDITGGGVIVASEDVDLNNARIDPDTIIISGDDVRVRRFSNVQDNSVIYAQDNVMVGGLFSRPVIHGSIIGEDVLLLGPMDVYGLLYAQDISFNMTFIFDQNLYGSFVSRASLDLSGFIGNINVHYDESYLPSPPPGLYQELLLIPGTWKEL